MMKPKFSQIGISGYRRLLTIDNMEMRPLIVMIGANGIGKTSFLEVFSLVASSAKGRLKNAISKLGGLHHLVTCGMSESMSFSLSMEIPGYEPLNYDLALKVQGVSYEIATETLSQRHAGYDKPLKYIDSNGSDIKYWSVDDRKLLRPNWEYDFSETALSQVPKMYQEPESFRKQLSSSTYYSAYALNLGHNSPIRLPQSMEPATHPGSNGEELVSCLYNLRETDRDRFEIMAHQRLLWDRLTCVTGMPLKFVAENWQNSEIHRPYA